MKDLLELASRKGHAAKPTLAWREARGPRLFCPKCRCLRLEECVHEIDIDLDPTYFPHGWKSGELNVGPTVVAWTSYMQVLRRDFAEALQLPPDDFYLGSVSIGGVQCGSYVSVVADPRVRIVIHPNIWLNPGSCLICGRQGGQYDHAGGFWVSAQDIGNRHVLADHIGGGPYVVESILNTIPKDIRSELRTTKIPIR